MHPKQTEGREAGSLHATFFDLEAACWIADPSSLPPPPSPSSLSTVFFTLHLLLPTSTVPRLRFLVSTTTHFLSVNLFLFLSSVSLSVLSSLFFLFSFTYIKLTTTEKQFPIESANLTALSRCSSTRNWYGMLCFVWPKVQKPLSPLLAPNPRFDFEYDFDKHYDKDFFPDPSRQARRPHPHAGASEVLRAAQSLEWTASTLICQALRSDQATASSGRPTRRQGAQRCWLPYRQHCS